LRAIPDSRARGDERMRVFQKLCREPGGLFGLNAQGVGELVKCRASSEGRAERDEQPGSEWRSDVVPVPRESMDAVGITG
jgi:hypothetical protein